MNIKKLVLFVLGLGFGFNSIAQTDVRITIDHSFNGSSASADQVYIIQESAFEYDRIQYYLSGFTIIHDGGQVTTIDDLVILVDSDHGNTYELGSLPVSNIENITFSVGVPEHLNHLDPSIYELNHPLAHQNPSMHWGWTSGYRFLCVDATSGLDMVQIHALGDAHYYSQSHVVNSQTDSEGVFVEFTADYGQIFDGLNVIGGLFEHSETSDPIIKALENMQNIVFYPTVTGIDESIEEAFTMYPNPASSDIRISGAKNGDLVTVYDLGGRLVLSHILNSSIDVSSLEEGVYIVSIDGCSSSRLVVTK